MTSRRRGWCPSARCSTSSPRAATTWRRSCSACTSPMRTTAAASTTARGRSMLALGVGLEEAARRAAGARQGSFSGGRDIGVVFNRPGHGGRHACCRPVGGVGAQYTPAAGWAQAIRYRARGARGRLLRAQHRRGARRRRLDRHQRLLVGAQHRHHPAPADAVLHRGQRATASRCRRTCRPPAATSPPTWPAFRGLHDPRGRRRRSAGGRRADSRAAVARVREARARCCCA